MSDSYPIKVVLFDHYIEIYENEILLEKKKLTNIFGYYFIDSKLIIKYDKMDDPEGGTTHRIYNINNVESFENLSTF